MSKTFAAFFSFEQEHAASTTTQASRHRPGGPRPCDKSAIAYPGDLPHSR